MSAAATSSPEALVAALVAAEGSLPLERIAAVLSATVPSAKGRADLVRALAADRGVLRVGAPPLVTRLVEALVAAGSTTLTAPVCARCGRTGRPLTRSETGGVCPSCRRRQTATACTVCGVVKPIAGRDARGGALCARCAPRPQRRCGQCGRTRAIARRARDGRPDICVSCFTMPATVCTRCGLHRPCSFAATDRAVCTGCAPRATAECSHCGADRPPTVRWPEGPVCEPCYVTALNRRDVCAECGQTRRLVEPPGPAATRCADCCGRPHLSGHVCTECGIEARLYERGRCERCALRRRTYDLLIDETETIAVALVPVAEAIIAAPVPFSALNWLRRGAGAGLLADLAATAAGGTALTHEMLDGHPRPRAAEYLRRLLVAHGVLSERDEALIRTERWTDELIAGIHRPADRRLVTAYATWRVLRRLRRRAERNTGPHTPTAAARSQIRAAAGLLDWLAARGQNLAEATQADIDAWLASGPSARQARDFLIWAAQHHHSRPLEVSTIGRTVGAPLDAEARWALLTRLLHDTTLALTDRVAGSLLLCYAQPLSRITALTLDHVTRTEQTTTIRFGDDDIAVPEPLAGLLAQHIATPRGYVGVGAPTSRWLFPGHQPGRPLTPARLGDRLGKLGINARAARHAALLQLAAEIPAAVLAQMLNLTPSTATRWTAHAGGTWNRYAATLANERDHQQAE